VLGGTAVIKWWPWQWRPEFLYGVPEALPFVLRMLLLLIALRVFMGHRRRLVTVPVVILMGSLLVAPPLHGKPPCGSVTVISQASIRPWANGILEMLVQEDTVECVKALRLTRDDGDLEAALESGGTTVGGIITSDPEAIRNLDPRPARKPVKPWRTVAIYAKPLSSWIGIGLDVASVSPGPTVQTAHDSSLPFGRSVPLSALSALPYRADGGTAAIAAKIAALGGSGTARVHADAAAGEVSCPNGVIAASSWAGPSCDVDEGDRATVLDGDGHPIGVPVLGIPIQASPHGTGPGKAAREAVTAFFARLRKELHQRSYLIPLTGDVADAVAESENLPPLVVRRPVRLVAVVDASLSTGRVTRDGAAPLDAALDGLRAFAGSRGPYPGDRLTIITAQDGKDAAGRRPVEQALPAARPEVPTPAARGETALPVFLAKAGSLQTAENTTTVRLLLTDGVNVFTEHKLDEPRLRDLTVLVIGNPRGCDAVPEPLGERCRPTPASAEGVAAQTARAFAARQQNEDAR
jgi:hypothetical protein